MRQKPHLSTHLVQLPAEALKNVMLVYLEDGLALIKNGVHDDPQRVHVRGGVTTNRKYVLRSQILWVREAEWRKVGFPLFARVLWLKTLSRK